MNYLVIILTAIGLSMDAFAVAIASGGSITEKRTLQAFRIGGSFGFFQMIMPLIGWALGESLKRYITSFDHWIAFGLLAFIGLKMLRESFDREACQRPAEPMTRRRLFFLSIATSIDALAVGVSFAFLDYPVFLAALVIGLITFAISFAGVFIGHFCCCLWGQRAERAGGVLLILIGLKILIEHLR
jgi:manganese efflux pump family protein